jgi:DNA-directed RNA polymerase specialized sigma24 family protein
MSAALQLPTVWGASNAQVAWQEERRNWERKPAARPESKPAKEPATEPSISLAFYRKHTESMLRRYLYASMQVGRAPSILGDPVARGWASSRPVRTFEDAVIFVLDIEKCLNQLGSLDRQMLSRIVLQEYTQVEAASLLGMSVRTISYKFPQAVDRLTEKLLATGLLVLPH